MSDNSAITNLTTNLTGTTAYNGSYWQGANISANDFASNLVWNENITGITKSNWDWDYDVTLNEDAVKAIVKKITKERELAKITSDDGPEIPKWTGFIEI